jgi:hypothetical protein
MPCVQLFGRINNLLHGRLGIDETTVLATVAGSVHVLAHQP